MINTKEYFLRRDDEPGIELSELIHPVMTVSEVMPVKTLLKKMQQERAHIAILVDEFGGTSGMVTIEDVLEEIVGEIRDEFDAEEQLEVEKLGEGHLIVDGKVTLTHLNDLLNTDITSEELDTIGGWLYRQIRIWKKAGSGNTRI